MKYGSREVTLKLERETTRLVHREPSVNASPDKFRKLLATHLPFSGRRVSNVGIVVADKTRLCQYSTYLPVLTGYLQESGIPPSGITFYIAYGTHAPQSEQECIESYGETYKQFRFVHHNSRDTGAFQALGTTSRGTSVKVAREVLQHDMLITFGAILHHYFAGYGGGRKLLFPGMGAYESILQNHRLFLDYKTRSPAAGCLSGQLDHNPLALDLEEISGLLPPHLEIYTILDSQKQVCEISAGTSYEEFRKVCQHYDYFFKSSEMQQFDLVVASAGGYPKDINFIQSHKSIQNAASFVKNGGKLIIFAECRDGIGNPGLMGLFRLGGKDNIFRELEVEYKNNAGTAISMLEKAERMEIRMVTTLSEEDCRFMGATRCLPEDVQHMIDSEKGSVAVLENAGMLYR
jgi:nickel-dependent lactate racemase